MTEEIRERIVDIRGESDPDIQDGEPRKIYFTDAVNLEISASEIRKKIRDKDDEWREDLTLEVAKYIEKYQIYN